MSSSTSESLVAVDAAVFVTALSPSPVLSLSLLLLVFYVLVCVGGLYGGVGVGCNI